MRLITLFFFLLSFSALGQSNEFYRGYFVTNNSDTIRCFIKDKGLNALRKKDVFYKTDSTSDEEKSIKTEDLVFIDLSSKGDLYRKFNIQDIIWARLLEAGKISLYEGSYNDFPVFFIVNDTSENKLDIKRTETVSSDGHISIRENHRYKGILKVWMSDYPELYPDIHNSKFTAKALSKLVNNYNKNFYVSSIGKEIPKQKLRTNPGILIGSVLNKSMVFYETPFSDVNQKYDLGLTLGAFINLSKHNRYNYLFSFSWSNYNSKILSYSPDANSTIHNVELQYQFLELGAAFRYNMSKKDFRPFLQLSGNIGYLTGEKFKSKFHFGNNPNYSTKEYYLNMSRFKVGIRPTFGISFKSKLGVYIEPFIEISNDGPNVMLRRTGMISALYWQF